MAKNKQQIKFEADVSGFKSAIKESEKQITSLNKELKLNSEQLKGNGKNVDLLQTRLKELQDKYKEQSEIVENTNKALGVAIDTFGENSEEAKKLKNQLIDAKTAQEKIKNAINETTIEINKQTSGWIDNGKALQDAGKIVENVGDKIDKLGNKVSVVSAGVGAALVGTSKAAIDYESAFAGVVKTVDGTEEQLQAINDGILEMSTRMPAAATEIAGVAESAGQLGIKTDNILSFSEAMIGLGESTNLTAEEAAQQLAKFANIMEMSQDDFDKLGSSIVDLGNNFATTEQDIVNMAMRLAGAGKQVGLSEGEVLGLATALSSVGIEAEMGGSAISKAMVRMQNSVELGGTKLNNVLSQTNMSLHDLQLMSTNDTKGFKALAGSLDMTSTELKNIVNAGVDLENFAKVSGKTTEEFKKQWKDDAAGALSDFIKGLGNAEEQGESAITMLSEMGLTEVRLRDSLLRAANAGNLFNNAIETGTNAWKENTALTKEVNKRYETTESQIKMLKNEATKLAIEFGRELLPVLKDLLEQAKPLIKNIGEGIKKFSSLDDKTKKTVISIAGFITIAGPLIKVVGNITSGVGKATTAIGKMSEKIGQAKSATDAAKSSTSNLSSCMGYAAIAVGLATAAIAAHEYAMNKIKKTIQESAKETLDLAAAIDTEYQSVQERDKALEDSYKTKNVELGIVQNLKDSLMELVDENGKVKEGYENRANYIVNELNEATGLEIRLIDGEIQKLGEVSDAIDAYVEKQKLKSYMDVVNDKYKETVAHQDEHIESLKLANQKYDEENEKLEEMQQKYQTIKDATSKLTGLIPADWTAHVEAIKKAVDEQQNVVDTAKKAKDEAQEVRNKDLENQAKYQHYTELYSQGTAEANKQMADEILYNTQGLTEGTASYYQKMIETSATNMKDFQTMYNDTGKDMYLEEIEKWKAIVQTNADGLLKITEDTSNMTEDQKSAWKTLADSDITTYATVLSALDDKTIRQIQDATDCVVSDEQLSQAFAGLGKDNIDGFMSNDFTQAGKDATSNIQTGVESISLYSAGQTVGGSFANGLLNKVRSAMAYVNSQQANGSHADGLAYVPYNGYVARLHEGERVLTKAENAEYMTNKINNSNTNATVNIYTQNMTKENMEKVCQFIERKWGGKS